MSDIPHKVFIVGFNVVPHSRDKLVSAITYVSSSAFAFFFLSESFSFYRKTQSVNSFVIKMSRESLSKRKAKNISINIEGSLQTPSTRAAYIYLIVLFSS